MGRVRSRGNRGARSAPRDAPVDRRTRKRSLVYPPSSSPAAPKQSDGENFAKAFKQDIADIDKKRSTTNEMRETVEKHKHYMSNSRERRVGLEALYLRWSIVCTALAVYGLPPPVT